MNSKQLNFFFSPEDLPFVYDFFNNMGIKYAWINDPEEVRSLRLLESRTPLAKEIDYLIEHGYKWVGDGSKLVKK